MAAREADESCRSEFERIGGKTRDALRAVRKRVAAAEEAEAEGQGSAAESDVDANSLGQRAKQQGALRKLVRMTKKLRQSKDVAKTEKPLIGVVLGCYIICP